MKKGLLCALFAAVAAVGNLSADILIDNFNEYTNTAGLQSNWNSFGTGASAGAATLSVGGGVDGTNAALYTLTWNAGSNANMRMYTIPSSVSDLSEAIAIDVTLRIATRSGFSDPTDPTKLKVVVQGADSVWQTNAASAIEVNSSEYVTMSFLLNTTSMERVEGLSTITLTDALSSLTSFRLRFENAQEADVRQEVYIDSIIAVTAVPEPGEYAAIAALATLFVAFVVRRRARSRS